MCENLTEYTLNALLLLSLIITIRHVLVSFVRECCPSISRHGTPTCVDGTGLRWPIQGIHKSRMLSSGLKTFECTHHQALRGHQGSACSLGYTTWTYGPTICSDSLCCWLSIYWGFYNQANAGEIKIYLVYLFVCLSAIGGWAHCNRPSTHCFVLNCVTLS